MQVHRGLRLPLVGTFLFSPLPSFFSPWAAAVEDLGKVPKAAAASTKGKTGLQTMVGLRALIGRRRARHKSNFAPRSTMVPVPSVAWRASIGVALGLQGHGTGVDGVIAPGGEREAGG
jgi:hypothetical protein